jgi:hypothetical protein
MFGGYMFAATFSWDIFASGGAFNASPDIIDSWAAFTCERVVLPASPENAILFGVQSIIY